LKRKEEQEKKEFSAIGDDDNYLVEMRRNSPCQAEDGALNSISV